ncbi:MAG TPA: HEAT repeat domain-containing protein [Bryobacteraceae bacterium]|jgi:HEAT repeat protein|nr:HEAT repeat domain-containing protein [Bryobacteraceae bacterium]
MKPALCLLAVLPLMAQPKLLVDAKVDTRSAAAGLEREFKALQAAQPQPAWIGYQVPAVRGAEMGCEYVRDGVNTAGIVHLEPPDHAVILLRVENNSVNKLRSLSPDCEIDAGGLPLHWLTDVAPAQSVALLATFVPRSELDSNGALGAIAAHADPAADAVLDRYLAASEPDWVRRRVASLEASERGTHGVEEVKKVLANDRSESVKQGAISGLARNKQPEALQVLIATAKTASEPRTRSQAISSLNRRPGPEVLDTINSAIASDPDVQVRRRAVDALGSLPDGAGVPALIQLVKSSKDPDVRKQAMNRLQNSHDSRAEAFFEEVLK